MQPRPAFLIVCGDLVDAYASLHPDIRCGDILRLLGVANNKYLHDYTGSFSKVVLSQGAVK